jgi:2-polyprenyl-6-methoxyphenol hydroxylase-like FAD-dependent oxidoreductase
MNGRRGDGADVVVVGGGFSGLLGAMAVASRGRSVLVLEATDRPSRAFRGELLHPFGVRALGALGMRACLGAAGAAEVEGFAVFAPGVSEPVLLPYETEPGVAFDHGRLVAELRAVLVSMPGVRLEPAARVASVLSDDGRVVGVRRADGTEHPSLLVVAADGRFSTMRKGLGLRATSALTSHTVAVEVPREALPLPDLGHVFAGAPGPVLAYPLAPRRARVCMDVPLGAATTRAGLVRYLATAYCKTLPRLLGEAVTISLEGGPLLGAPNHTISVRESAVPGAVLLGDAAGCSHPLAATGMTCAVHDAAALHACLGQGVSLESVPEAYRERRDAFARARAVFAECLYAVFAGRGGGARALRDGMFRHWQSGVGARRRSMRLLAGEESRFSSFLAEYGRVLGASSAEVLANFSMVEEPLATASALSSIVAVACTSIATAAKRTL